ncbi:membrane protein [Maribacter sp. HTCC2170]|uniref:membrane protein n=1 Tax=Maribacter sp. (strain HTCC2170 / KCCM 42371) TaxID=313603 RepID=UPI0005A19838|nr:membrane protein [Maribacter sp. HTCC2170]
MMQRTNILLILALFIGVAFHGSSIFFTLESTYDALIHLFFADHYAQSWFEPWDYRWYTGFTVQAYPPLVHQTIAVLSYIGGLKFGLFSVALIGIILFITGAYRFGLLMTGNRKVAGYTALLAVFSSTFIETLHIFGQLPSIVGLSVLLHALPEIYSWIKTGKSRYLATSLSLIAVTVTSHHVTPIFGMVFFIFPLLGMVVMDAARDQVANNKAITFKVFLVQFKKLFWRIVGFGFSSLVLIVVCILPYWINSKKNPITQVPIPHGSRDNFLEVTSSGLVFFLIPWGVLLFILPYIFYRYFSKRYLFFGLSFAMLTLLGTGGTTPIPIKLLGETAFNILTLDRFTLWATIMALPIFGEFMYRMTEGDLKVYIQQRFGPVYHRIIGGSIAGGILVMVIFTMSLNYFRPSQPQNIKMLPIVNFLSQDDHDKWRYLPLGFGDQMAWLSAQTNAMTVDGNYHSARRLPELTTRAIERLENSKFRGVEGIGSLQQFLTVPEKYNLKYIFSNDKFYDPILYFCGWQRLQQLENGIMVWEKLNVPPIPTIISKEDVATWLKVMWGIIPLLTVILALIINIQWVWYRILKSKQLPDGKFMNYALPYKKFPRKLVTLNQFWALLIICVLGYGAYHFYISNATQIAPKNVLMAYYDALDFKEFQRAHSYLNPDDEVDLSQYMLEVSVTDGILSSYAKLDSIGIELMDETATSARAKVSTQWITPLEKVNKHFYHTLVKKDGKWYLEPSKFDNDLPPDQLLSANGSTFYNHGRRRITTQQTHHEDVLKQPVLEVLKAKLVKYQGRYSIVGELQNIDNIPADVVIKATLYNDTNKELANYNAKFQMKHKLMPKETTAFRIDFEGIAWSSTKDTLPPTFNPDEFTPVTLEEQPTKFNLQCAGNTAITDLYKQIALQDLELTEASIKGTLFNSGIQEVTIPQLLLSYYNEEKELLWVDHHFLQEGVRIQRKQFFDYKPLDLSNLQIISSSLENCFVNGLPNTSISEIIFPNRVHSHALEQLQPFEGKGYRFLKFEVNGYIGNPR